MASPDRILDALISEDLVKQEIVDELLKRPQNQGRPLEKLLVEQSVVTELQMTAVLARLYKVELVDLNSYKIDMDAIRILNGEVCSNYCLLPIKATDKVLTLAMADPLDIVAEDFVRYLTGLDIVRMIAPRSDVIANIDKLYTGAESVNNILEKIPFGDDIEFIQKKEEEEEKEDEANAAPVVKLVSALLVDAVKMRASDIHVEPVYDGLRIRYRIDGLLREIAHLPKPLQNSVLSRMKLVAGMDISEKRRPQDGRSNVRVGGREIDLRVNSLPSFFGEKICMRILDKKKVMIDLESMGFVPRDFELFNTFIRNPQGMLIITGPTGSGKTSTLYAALNKMNLPTENIVTVEDPVEFQLGGINQVQINERAGLSFSAALRAILRQEPNVVMLGEIRDLETAEIALQAAMTGHFVLSTLHTNNAPSTINRLLYMGVAGFLLASTLLGVVAQRLVRKICPHCREPFQPEESSLHFLKMMSGGKIPDQFFHGKGCEECDFQGYSGRMGVFEIMAVTDKIKVMIYAAASEADIYNQARKDGMTTLLEDGLEKCRQGLTTLEEVMRVAPGEFTSEDDEEPQTVVSHSGPKEERAAGNGQPPVEPQPVDSERPTTPAHVQIPAGAGPAPGFGRTLSEVSEDGDDKERKEKVLVVDDDPVVREVVKRALTREFYEVMVAPNGREALEKIWHDRPDLIISDVRMPEMDGYEFTRRLRRHLTTSLIPLIMLTSANDQESEIQGLDAGADDFITKPVEIPTLLARVATILRRSRDRMPKL